MGLTVAPPDRNGALHELLNFHSFSSEYVLFTKSAELHMFVKLEGIDAECRDAAEVERITRTTFESATRHVPAGMRVYTIRLKTAGPPIPRRQSYPSEIVETLISNHLNGIHSRAAQLFSVETYVVFSLPLPKSAVRAGNGLSSRFSKDSCLRLLKKAYNETEQALARAVDGWCQLVNDVLPVRKLEKREIFRLPLRMLNPAPEKQELELPSDSDLDLFLANSSLGCFEDHLRIDDRFVTVLTLKAPPSQTRPNLLSAALDIPCTFALVQEWLRLPEDKARMHANLQQRHYSAKRYRMMPTQLFRTVSERDQLNDAGALANIAELDELFRDMEVNNRYLGEFSLTVVVTGRSLEEARGATGEFQKVFARHDAVLIPERYNLLPAYLAHLPGNHKYNFRRIYLTDANYADFAPMFAPFVGNLVNGHLGDEYLAVVETNDRAPHFLNLHHGDNGHTTILGGTGAGKSVLVQFLLTHAQKYSPQVFIFDVGGSYRAITQALGGSYLHIGRIQQPFQANPLSLANTADNRLFLASFVRLLTDRNGFAMSTRQETEVAEGIENIYRVDSSVRRLGTLAAMLSRELAEQLAPWVNNGKFASLFDNLEDTLTLSRFQTFDFERVDNAPELVTTRLFYMLHRINEQIASASDHTTLKLAVMDEAWWFLGHPVTSAYIREVLKTWRKRNGVMILATQSSDDLERSEIFQVMLESCPTKVFLPTNDMKEELYARLFHLNAQEINRIRELRPKKQFLLKQPHHSKVLNLNLDPKSYELFTTNPYEVKRREEAFAKYGILDGLHELTKEKHA